MHAPVEKVVPGADVDFWKIAQEEAHSRITGLGKTQGGLASRATKQVMAIEKKLLKSWDKDASPPF